MTRFHLHTAGHVLRAAGALLLLWLLLGVGTVWSDDRMEQGALVHRPLGEALVNGRLARTATGSFDARGWRMTIDSDGTPRFLQSPSQAEIENAGWDRRFGPAGNTSTGIFAVAVDGDDVYIGGGFKRLGNESFNGIAHWDGGRWSSLGVGVDGRVLALAIVGDRLYVGGQFDWAGGLTSPNFAIWNRSSSSWTAIRNGVTGDDDACVATMLVHGADLYIGGKFNASGNTLANNVARYDGSRFTRLGPGTLGPVFALAINGDYMYLGGMFTAAGNVPASNIARMSLSTRTWEAMGTGTDSAVFAIAPDGNDIYIGGRFDSAGGLRAYNVVRWNEVSRSYSMLAGGITTDYPYPPPQIRSIVVDGDNVYIGGMYIISAASDATIRCFARYHKPTNTFNNVGTGMIAGDAGPIIMAIVKSGRELYIVGDYPLANGMVANGFSIYDMDADLWRLLGGTVPGLIRAGAYWNGNFVAGGSFRSAGGAPALNIARWRDGRWFPLGAGVYTDASGGEGVMALAAAGDRLIVGGDFAGAGNSPMRGVAAWDGSRWQSLAGGITGSNGGVVAALAVMGADIYAGGRFDSLGGRQVWGLGRWDGTSWSELGSGIQTIDWAGQPQPGDVSLLLADGDRLYVVGTFQVAGGQPAAGFAIWNASSRSWSVPDKVPDGQIRALALHRGTLIVAGRFKSVAGMSATVAAYDPVTDSWSALAGRVSGGLAETLASDGRYLYLGGSFTAVDSADASSIAKWDGSGWSSVGTGTDGVVDILTADTTGVFAVGTFTQTGAVAAARIGHWTPQPLAAVPIAGEDAVAGALLGVIHPNPAVEETTVPFLLRRPSHVSIEIFAPNGARVASLADARFAPGLHSVTWRPESEPSGLYLCRLIADGRVETRTIVVRR